MTGAILRAVTSHGYLNGQRDHNDGAVAARARHHRTGVRVEQRRNTFHTRSLQHLALRRLDGDELHKSAIA